MDSVNSKSTPLQEETSEQPKHKIWSPIPRKLRKVEDGNFEIQAVVTNSTNNDDSPISAKDSRESFKAYNPKASAFRKIFSDSNSDNGCSGNPKLTSSHSGVSNSDAASAVTADTLNGDKSNSNPFQHDPLVSVFYRNTPKFSLINTDHDSPFGKSSKQLETPKFRINLGELSANNGQNPKRNLFSEYPTKPEPLSQSFLPEGYFRLFSNMIKNESDCGTPNQEKEEQKRGDKCNHNGNNENTGEKIAKFLKPNISKKKSRHCNCRNSKCLKLYCECLAYGEYCDDRCNCCDCHNNVQKEEARSYALSLIMEKKPEILEAASLKKQNSSKIVRGKGCNCKKSACLKKYCECFNSGAGCGPECKCEGCKNPHARPEGLDSNKSIETAISPDITQGLGLTLKEKSFSELDPHLQSLRLGRDKPLLNRGISEKSTDGFPALPLFSLENRL